MSITTNEAINAGYAPVHDHAAELYAAEQARMADDARAEARLESLFQQTSAALSEYADLSHVAFYQGGLENHTKAAKQAARVAYLADALHAAQLEALGREAVRNA